MPTNKNSISRDSLLKAVMMVRPALSTTNFVPHLQHILFKDGFALAYNDTMAIQVMAPDLGEDVCVPGELAGKALTSFGGAALAITIDDAAVTLSSGRSRVKLPYLSASDFPFDGKAPLNSPKLVEVCDIGPAFYRGLERCLVAVGNDATHPAQRGVTLDSAGGKAVLYSTDNFTISRYTIQTDLGMDLPGDTPIIIPTSMAQQIIALGKIFPGEPGVLSLSGGLLVANLNDKAAVFCKQLTDLDPLDFPGVFKKYLPSAKNPKEFTEAIPESFDSAVERALLVLTGEVDKVLRVSENAGSLRLSATSAAGETDDSLPFEGVLSAAVCVDPALVSRGIKGCSHIAWLDRGLLLADEDHNYLHLISYCVG